MYAIEQLSSPVAGFRLRDGNRNASVDVAPDRGGLITGFRVGIRDVLYLDEATLVDRSKNVRGGIPILFPIAGKLPNDQYSLGGQTFTLKQHGFARNLPWTVTATDTVSDARITLTLNSTGATREVFPFEFEVRMTYSLRNAVLTIDAEYRNTGLIPMPLHAGFHPYFRVADAQKSLVRVATDATRAWDNAKNAAVAFSGFDLTRPEVDLALLDHSGRESKLSIGDETLVRLTMDPTFTTLVVWTVAGKDYVCLEPWTAPGNALNTGERMLLVPPGQIHRAQVVLSTD